MEKQKTKREENIEKFKIDLRDRWIDLNASLKFEKPNQEIYASIRTGFEDVAKNKLIMNMRVVCDDSNNFCENGFFDKDIAIAEIAWQYHSDIEYSHIKLPFDGGKPHSIVVDFFPEDRIPFPDNQN
jgi:hypothetical protein